MEQIDMNKIYKTNFGFAMDYKICQKNYLVQLIYPQENSSYHIPYILVTPNQMKEKATLSVEVNNLESDNQEELLKNGLFTAYRLTKNLIEFDNPVLIPILPSVKNGIPYYQQLSKECFSVPKESPYYRIDLQVCSVIDDAKKKLSNQTTIDDKIFLNGYSSSGVFAQRFALLHPERVDTACIGGASGSIPIPLENIGYPIGIGDYEKITGHPFDMEAYEQIKFRYYVGLLEDTRKTNERFDENGHPAPMHDMSYFRRSIPTEVGIKQREIFGKNLIERSEREIEIMKEMGIDITQQVMEGRTHNNFNGNGVNELGDSFIKETYQNRNCSKQL